MKTLKLYEVIGLTFIICFSLLFLPSFFDFAKVVNIWKLILNDLLLFTWRFGRQQDQFILSMYVWKFFGPEMSLQHDSYRCKRYKGSVGWPTQRLIEPNNIVGSIVKGNGTWKME